MLFHLFVFSYIYCHQPNLPLAASLDTWQLKAEALQQFRNIPYISS